MVLRALLTLAFLAAGPPSFGQTPSAPPDATTALIAQLEQAAAAGNGTAIRAMGVTPDAAGLGQFATLVAVPPTRLIIKERDRGSSDTLDRLLIEVFTQHGVEAGISTWRVDVIKDPASSPHIFEMEQLTVVSGLFKLALNPARQFNVRNLTVRGTDLTLSLPSGLAFVAETPTGPTAVVLLGRGRMRFTPSDPAERTQVRIFSGEEILAVDFDAAFIRLRPADFDEMFPESALSPRPVAQNDFRRANDVFEDYVGQTLNLDLTDLSRERWSLVPSPGDLIAEIRTRGHGSLTYARSSKDAEDVSLFDRRKRRNIAVYASAQKLATRGPFYNEDDLVEYDVLRQDLEVAFSPDRLWIEGQARIDLKIRSYALAALTLRLAEPLVVRSVISPQFGRLLHLRVIGQNSVIVNFPTTVMRDTEVRLDVTYGGRLEPQQLEREGIAVAADQQEQREEIYIHIEPQYLYSNRSYWYPQATVTDYSTAHVKLSVPPEYDVVATGTPAGPPVAVPDSSEPDDRARTLFVFESAEPVRYLACVISRFNPVTSRQVSIARGRRMTGPGERPRDVTPSPAADGAIEIDPGPAAADTVTLNVHANPRQVGRARSLTTRAASIFEFYGSLVGEAPYPTFALAVTESALPGGHSPAYFAVLNQPLPLFPLVWRNDPVAFDNYGPFFLAHEIAHQWWGQAIGWKNYHEQWLSEGFAQYFAAMYAAHDRGDDLFSDMLRQMRKWAIEQSPQGPVYLGYRLGHIKGDGRVFRALVYNKGAMVLHMLRRLVGDEAFFSGLRRFYGEWKFRKAGTNDLRMAMEGASGRDLAPFFAGWIYGSGIPSVRFTSSVAGRAAKVRLEHREDVIPLPVTVTITYTDGRTEDVVVVVEQRVVERSLPLTGTVRSIDVNRDNAAVAEFSR